MATVRTHVACTGMPGSSRGYISFLLTPADVEMASDDPNWVMESQSFPAKQTRPP